MDYGERELKRSSKGPDVVELQIRLAGFRGTLPDGKFGPGTERQVMTFQRLLHAREAANRRRRWRYPARNRPLCRRVPDRLPRARMRLQGMRRLRPGEPLDEGAVRQVWRDRHHFWSNGLNLPRKYEE